MDNKNVNDEISDNIDNESLEEAKNVINKV